MQTYRHKQTGTLLIWVFSILILLAITGIILDSSAPNLFILGLVSAVSGVCMIFFSVLTVEVNSHEIIITFGLGVFRKKFDISGIRNTEAVRNSWYYGWGIRLLRNGWLYNVSGFDAVEIELKNNRRYRIGTDDPDGLLAAIKQASGLTKE